MGVIGEEARTWECGDCYQHAGAIEGGPPKGERLPLCVRVRGADDQESDTFPRD